MHLGTDARRRGWLGALALTLLRLSLAPAFVICASSGTRGWILALMLAVGFASDVLDGVVARRYGAITPFLRRLDSSVDTVFYLAVAYAAWVASVAGTAFSLVAHLRGPWR